MSNQEKQLIVKEKNKIKTHYDSVFKTWITVFVEKDEVKARKKIEKIIGESLEEMSFESQAKTVEYVSSNGGQRMIVWLKKPQYPLLAHELVHVIEYCFERRRIPFTIENSEVIAYYMEYLMDVFDVLL